MNEQDKNFAAWIGRSETVRDEIGAAPVRALTATLDHPLVPVETGTALPPLWHWLYFLPLHRQSDIGPDGHARRGGFMPPVPLPRRMWAGSQFEFRTPIRVGDRVSRRSTIADVSTKEGRSGPARLRQGAPRGALQRRGRAGAGRVPRYRLPRSAPARRYRTQAAGRARRRPQPPWGPARGDGGLTWWRREIVPDDVLLFRYSALAFNGHRIHYDRRYVTEVEGYPGLVVQGPLIATLLMDLLCRQAPQADVASFRFKAVRATFDGRPMRLNGEPSADGKSVHLWAQDHEGWLTMDATATLR